MPLQDYVPGTDAPRGRRRLSLSLAGLLFGNLTLIGSFTAGWIELPELLWTYWLQSVAIGVFNFFRMMALRRFTTKGLTSNGRPVPETPEGKRRTARFFLVHYGGFHFGYAVFLLVEYPPTGAVGMWMLASAFALVASEWATFQRHRASDATWEPNLGTLMFQPYLRIIPMHLAIGGAGLAGTVFLPLKVLADLGMYAVDERMDANRARHRAATVAAPGA